MSDSPLLPVLLLRPLPRVCDLRAGRVVEVGPHPAGEVVRVSPLLAVTLVVRGWAEPAAG